MKTHYIIGLTAFAASLTALTAPAGAQNTGQDRGQDGGMLSTMPQGIYQCALPGDAGGVAYTVVAGEDFRLGAASSYENTEGRGVYLLKGKVLTFTRGPKKGEKFRRIGTNQLRKLDANGSMTKMLCTRLGAQRFTRD